MEITLEKIELVKDRTGATYKDAKEALEKADGSVVDAIIDLEESMKYNTESEESSKSNEFFEKIKRTAEKGNMSRIVVKKDDEILLNFPLTVSILGAVVAPWGVIFGVIAAAGFNCKIEFVNDKGEVTDVNGKVMDSYSKAKTKSQEYKEKGQDTINKVKESEFYNDVKEKSSDAINKIKESEFYNDVKEKGEDAFEDLKGKGQETVDNIKEKSQEKMEKLNVKENIDEIKKKGQDIFKKNDEEDVIPVVDVEDVSVDVDQILDEVAEENGVDFDAKDKEKK